MNRNDRTCSVHQYAHIPRQKLRNEEKRRNKQVRSDYIQFAVQVEISNCNRGCVYTRLVLNPGCEGTVAIVREDR